MSIKEAKKLSKLKIIYPTILAIKFNKILIGRLEGVSGILVQTDSISEHELEKEIRLSYRVLAKYYETDYKIIFPELGNMSIRYVDNKEFLK